jgi:hypothetical protein
MSKRVTRKVGVMVSVALGFGAALLSGTADASEQWVVDNIRSVYPLGNGSFVITFINPQPTCVSGGSPQYFYVSPGENGTNSDGVKAMLATALTAFAMGKKIRLSYESATDFEIYQQGILG